MFGYQELNLNLIERVNSQLQLDVSGVKEVSKGLGIKISKVKLKVNLIDEDFDQLDFEFEELQTGQKCCLITVRNVIYVYGSYRRDWREGIWQSS